MKKGFTLIELLAVIVILAIIAVIAVPIVLNIIDETKNNVTLRSAEMYVKALELSIAQATLKDKNITDDTYNLKNGDICLNETCTEVLEVEVNGSVPESGTITITNGNIIGLSIELDGKEIYKNSKGELVYFKFLDEVCELKSGTPKTAGAKYECKVDPNKDPYIFYVLTTPQSTDTSINLIMDRNICEDGTTATTEKRCFAGWIIQSHYESVGGVIPEEVLNDGGACQRGGLCSLNDKGPLTIMKNLQETTKNWTNTNEMILDTFADETGATHDMPIYNTYARLPYYSEVGEVNETNTYLYDNLACVDNTTYGSTYDCVDGVNHINSIYGYWTLTSSSRNYQDAWYVSFDGRVGLTYVDFDNITGSSVTGVRPVINLKI